MLRLVWTAAKASWLKLKILPACAAVALGSAGLGEPQRPGRLVRACAIILPIGLLTLWLLSHLVLVMSPSIDAWAVRAVPGEIRRGDLVSFLLVHPLAGPKPVNVTKYALCLPGDRIVMVERPSTMSAARNGWYYCNDQLLGVSKPKGRKGQRLDHWSPPYGVVPDGLLYVGSHDPRGFDSRYYGPVSIKRLTRMEKLL